MASQIDTLALVFVRAMVSQASQLAAGAQDAVVLAHFDRLAAHRLTGILYLMISRTCKFVVQGFSLWQPASLTAGLAQLMEDA
jgi:hypothetical protein